MLKYVVGDSVFTKICQTYFQRWQFKHVNEKRFKDVCEEVSATNLGWFFSQWLHNTPKIDYALGRVATRSESGAWLTDVEIVNNGNGNMPVVTQMVTQAGDTLKKRWDGFGDSGKILFETASRPGWVELDPADEILDISRFNNQPVRAELTFAYPNMSYLPRKAYLLTWRPEGWYNKVDQLRLGGRLKGRQYTEKTGELGLWYGTQSKELDARFRILSRLRPLGDRASGTFTLQKLEGRFEIDAHLSFDKAKYLALPPTNNLRIGFNHTHLIDPGYTLKTFTATDTVLATWQKGNVNKLYLRYAVDPRGMRWFSSFNFGWDTVQKDWGSDATYNMLFSDTRLWLRTTAHSLAVRLYAAKLFQPQNALLQDFLFLDAANPRDQYRRLYLRSHDALPTGFNYHLPGGGNMRGYLGSPIYGNEILASNIEISRQFRKRRIQRGTHPWSVQPTLTLFGDIAWLNSPIAGTQFYADAGIGFRFEHLLPDRWLTLLTGGRDLIIRLDFPVWVNEPVAGQKSLRFRWLFGFEQVI
jgi:hypothetical protein